MNMKIDDKELLSFYYIGYELASDNKDFPKNFQSLAEKKACLLGYNDYHISVEKEKDEIITEIRTLLK